VTELTRRFEILHDVDKWFAERGFGLILTLDGDEYWAHLFPKQSLQINAPTTDPGRARKLLRSVLETATR
jgi:hypothetical protein